jgi:hypothetical protein
MQFSSCRSKLRMAAPLPTDPLHGKEIDSARRRDYHQLEASS